jgi:hypothetical protein
VLPAPRLQCPPGMVVRTWNEGLSIVFCPSSGMTVLVTDEAGAILQQVSETAEGLEALPGPSSEVVDGLLRSGLLVRVG